MILRQNNYVGPSVQHRNMRERGENALHHKAKIYVRRSCTIFHTRVVVFIYLFIYLFL
jgi:hypothetical protein